MEYVEDEFTPHGQLKIKFGRNALVRKDENCLSRSVSTWKKVEPVPQHDFLLGVHS